MITYFKVYVNKFVIFYYISLKLGKRKYFYRINLDSTFDLITDRHAKVPICDFLLLGLYQVCNFLFLNKTWQTGVFLKTESILKSNLTCNHSEQQASIYTISFNYNYIII